MGWAREALTMEGQIENYIETLRRVQADSAARRGFRLPDVLYVGDMIAAEAQA